MKLLTRYVIREHAGPLVFALSALTSLLMLQYVARQLANLAGKGLPWAAIGKFFVLSLPFTVAMTLPMAVLVATLYAFGRMAAEHEITAFKASGVRVRSLMAPVLVCAFLLSLFMVWFNDQLLPRTNHELRILNSDIARTKPTLALKEQVMNPITDQFFMRVARVDARTNRMYDVTIYDLRKGPERQTIYADSGVFLLDARGEDLQLQLMDGHAQEFLRGDAKRLQRTYFRTQTVQLRGIVQQFEATAEDNYRGDREQTVCQMHRTYMENAREFKRLRDEYMDQAGRLAGKGKLITVSRDRPGKELLSTFYCETMGSRLAQLFLPKKARAQAVQPPAGQQPPGQQPPTPPVTQPVVQPPVPAPTPSTVTPPVITPVDSAALKAAMRRDSIMQDSTQRGILPDSLKPDSLKQRDSTAVAATVLADSTSVYATAMRAAQQQLLAQREVLDGLSVEIHKKFALSFACIVFVLFGPPIALRFPRGGVGATIGVSIVVFGLYYVCLMGGEALADKGKLPAFIAMWIANVLFSLAGIALLWRVESTTDASRGGGLREWLADRTVRRQLARERKARAQNTVTA
ncbi:LptF/LptG family permease [Gemmatimonas sp.]|uniref:LptF/LptG family permease n=1 Tax=Gemmatimonas sp. TaxID=1962908 RepID=UPI0027BA0481|nr:LptF/LptG family permease [Gemmatimonas sp.]